MVNTVCYHCYHRSCQTALYCLRFSIQFSLTISYTSLQSSDFPMILPITWDCPMILPITRDCPMILPFTRDCPVISLINRDCPMILPITRDRSDGFIIFTNPSARAGYDTRSIFKWSLTGLNSVFLLLD